MAGQPTSEILDRMPPNDLAAERAVLGCGLLDPRTLDDSGSIVRPDDFYAEGHQKLFAHLLAMRADDQEIDAVLLVDRLKQAGDLEVVGGVAGLAEIAQSVPAAIHAAYYARIVATLSARRKVIHVLTETLADVWGHPDESIEELVARVEAATAEIQTGQFRGEPQEFMAVVANAMARIDAIADHRASAGVMIGLVDYDEMIGGFFAGELIVLAARPRVGKTALACQIARRVATGRRVYFASLEMSSVELATRMLCSESGVNSRLIRTGQLQPEDVAALVQTSNAIAPASLLIHDRPGLSVADIRRACRRLADKGLGLVIVDYLQRITPAETRTKRYEQVAAIAKDLKTLARELDVPVLCLAQLGRDADKEGRPQLHHLRESGDIEAEADVVAFLVRPAPWSEDELKAVRKGALPHGLYPPPHQAALVIEKNRNGPTATLKLRWEAERTRFISPDEWS